MLCVDGSDARAAMTVSWPGTSAEQAAIVGPPSYPQPHLAEAARCGVVRPMPRQAHVPDRLRQAPFRGSRAVADGLLSRRQLQSSAWVQVLRDVFVHSDVKITDTVRGRALL